MSQADSLYMVRAYKENDLSFIKATFLRGMYYGDSWFSQIPKDIFMENYSLFLDKLLEKRQDSIAVACLREDQDVILGYSVMSNDLTILDFVYVKTAWRKQGIARRLTPRSPIFVSHLTKLGATLMQKLDGTVFNPFKI
jgi:hypothetical protein